MSVTNEAASEPSGESMDASTMALSMRPRSTGGMTVLDEVRQDLVRAAGRVSAGCCV